MANINDLKNSMLTNASKANYSTISPSDVFSTMKQAFDLYSTTEEIAAKYYNKSELDVRVATADKLGFIKIGYTQSGANYPIQLDKDNKAYVTLALGETDVTAYKGSSGKALANNLSSHVANKSNPHGVTKAQVGLGDVANTGDSSTPVSGGTTKFTTGGAYSMKTDLQNSINTKAAKTNTVNGHQIGSNVSIPTIDNSTKLTNQDLNTLHGNGGFYYAPGGNTCTNMPSGVISFGLVVSRGAGGWWSQTLTGNDGKIYYRQWDATKWTPWVRVYTTGDKPSKSDVGLSNVVNTGDSATPVSGGTTKFTTGGAYSMKSELQASINTKANNSTTVNGHPLTSNVTVTKADVGLGNLTNDSQVKRSEMGAKSGVATLDANGLIPSSQLPSYVDDVLEYASLSKFPTKGETGKIYVATDTNLTYRWSGTSYVEISKSLALGTTSSTAYAGNLGAQLRTDLNSHTSSKSNPHGVTKAQVGLGNVANLDQSKAIKSLSQSGITYTATYVDGTTGTAFTTDGSTIINSLSTGTAVPGDSDYFISQYVGGGTTTTSYHRRPISTLYSYIKSKLSKSDLISILGFTPISSGDGKFSNYLPLSGGTMTGRLTMKSNPIWIQGGSDAGGDVNRMTLTSGMPTEIKYNGGKRGTVIYSNAIAFGDPLNGNSNNDAGWIRHLETTANSGILEIATGDDGNEGIVFRRYNNSNNVSTEVVVPNASGTLALTSQIPTVPSSLKNPNALTISLNGTSQGAYDGSSAKSINITPGSIGAAAASHSHSYLPLNGGTMTGDINFAATGTTGTSKKIVFSGSTDGAQIYYNVPTSDQGNLVLNMVDDTNAYIQFAYNGKVGSYISPSDGMYHGKATSASVADSVAWSNVSGRPSSMPSSDVSAWAKASTKPSYSWSEITSKPGTFTPSAHTHNSLTNLGAYTASAPTSNTKYLGNGLSWATLYSGGGPCAYGNILELYGTGAGQLCMEWSGGQNAAGDSNVGRLYYRSKRDIVNGWTTWKTVAWTSDIPGVATTGANGLMSAADKSKLNGIAAGAQVNTITGIKGSAESSYRTGQVNITPANLGITVVNNTADSAKHVAYAATAGSATDNTKLPLSGGTMTGSIIFSNSGTSLRGIQGTMGDNDQWRVMGGATESNSGYLEIATSDDGDEPIYVRQYNTGTFGNLVRTATLLDGNGNTSFPGSISEGGTLLSNKYQPKGSYAPASHTHNFLKGSQSSSVKAATCLANDSNISLTVGLWATTDAGFSTQWGSVLDLNPQGGWRERLAFNTNGTIEYWHGINTTTMSKVGNLVTSSNIGSYIPNLPASKITSGTFSADRIPSIPKSKITDFPSTEEWTFTLSDGSTVTKKVYIG